MIFHETGVWLDESLSLEEKEQVVGWWVEIRRYDSKKLWIGGIELLPLSLLAVKKNNNNCPFQNIFFPITPQVFFLNEFIHPV